MNNPQTLLTQYTTRVKHASRWSLILTILVATTVAFQVVHQQQRSLHISKLLNSPAITDKLEAIELLQHASFDTLCLQLASTASESNEAATAAQKLLVKHAFRESRVAALASLHIDDELLVAVRWWDGVQENKNPITENEQRYELVATNPTAAPWIRRLAALHCTETTIPIEDLIDMPLRDRDGSVMLAVLAIKQHLPANKVQALVESWVSDYDTDRQKAAILLASLSKLAIPTVHTHDLTLATLYTICSKRHTTLAWRSMHKPNGMINPDITLAALSVDQKLFLPILSDTAKTNNWAHPEHPVELARHFKSSITDVIPEELLDQESTRSNWWDIFACGLLLEER